MSARASGEQLIFEASLEDFAERVVQASHATPVLVDFWADWCAPCHAIAPHITRVVNEFGGRVRLAKVEVDEGENMKLAGHYRLRGFPTIMLFVAGEERGRFSGSRASHWIHDWVLEHAGAVLGAA
jgi:putative thioredoxin